MTVRDHLGRSLAVGGALAVLGVGAALTMTEQALAVAPAPTAGGTGATLSASSQAAQNNKTIGPLAGVVTTLTITVPESAQSVLRDVDVRTFIKHSGSGDLDIELTSPTRPGQAARTVKLVRGPSGAGGANDVFDGTLWDDSSLVPASDLDPAILGEVAPQANLTPEGALGRFVGIDPRGTWTLKITDTADVDVPDDGDPATPPPPPLDGGTLTSWALDLATQDTAPALAPVQTIQSAPGDTALADFPAPPTTSTINVTGAKGYLWDLDLVTDITHPEPGDLEIRLSHGGRTALIASRVNGGTVFYENRTFDDSGATLLNLATDAPGSVIPEGALSAFRGMDPNGAWTLSVTDKAALDVGTLHSWQLKIAATDAGGTTPPDVTPPDTTPPVVTPPVATPSAPVASVLPPPATPRALAVGVKTFGVSKNVKKSTLALNVGWLNGAGRVSYTATLSTKIGKKTVKKSVSGSGAAGSKTVRRTVSIPKTWQGRKITIRLVVKNGNTSVIRNKTISKF